MAKFTVNSWKPVQKDRVKVLTKKISKKEWILNYNRVKKMIEEKNLNVEILGNIINIFIDNQNQDLDSFSLSRVWKFEIN